MQSMAQSWLVYRLTGLAGLLGLVGFAGQIPVFLFAPFGGAVADARGRRPILLVTQTLSMLLALTLAAVLVCIAGALVFGVRLPTLRPQARRIILAQQAAAGEPAQGITGSATASDAR
jgi:MFS family permease